MLDTYLVFEYFGVDSPIICKIDSVKNPKSGIIEADEIGEIIKAGSIMEDVCEIKIRKGTKL